MHAMNKESETTVSAQDVCHGVEESFGMPEHSEVFQWDLNKVRAWFGYAAVRNTDCQLPADAAAGKGLLGDETLTSLGRFMECFREEEACHKALFYLRWPNGFVCPYCAEHHYYYISSRKLYECRACGNQTSVTANTFLHGTKLPLGYWFFTIYWVAVDQHCTAYRLASVLRLHYRTALRMLHVIRAAMRVSNGRHMLSSVAKEGPPAPTWNVPVDVDAGTCTGQGTDLDSDNPIEVGENQEHEIGQAEGWKHSLGGVKEEDECIRKEEVPMPFYMHRDLMRSHPLLDKCHNLLMSKAEAYIRAAYRRVSVRHRQRYVDEFVYQWLQRYELDPIHLGKRLLRACGKLVYQQDIQAWIRPVFPAKLSWPRRSGVAHPDQAV